MTVIVCKTNVPTALILHVYRNCIPIANVRGRPRLRSTSTGRIKLPRVQQGCICHAVRGFNSLCTKRLTPLRTGIVSSGNAWERRSQSYFDSGNGVLRNAVPALCELYKKHPACTKIRLFEIQVEFFFCGRAQPLPRPFPVRRGQ